jgi:hypothetical protein
MLEAVTSLKLLKNLKEKNRSLKESLTEKLVGMARAYKSVDVRPRHGV